MKFPITDRFLFCLFCFDLISLLPVLSRPFEKIVYDQLYMYLNSKNLIHSVQSGFQSFHSVLTCLLKCTNDWYFNMDKGPGGGSRYLSTRGIRVNIWGLRYRNKIIYGVCELQLRKNSIFGARELQLKKNIFFLL